MNRLDRLFAIATYLQGRRQIRADDLAARFEVSSRTIYRDIAALAEAGIPVVSLPGQGYQLVEGFFLPPLVFTSPEATALILGARLLSSQASPAMAAAADRAVAKVAAVLDDSVRQDIARLEEAVRFLPNAVARRPLDLADPGHAALREAILQQHVVTFSYQTQGTKDAIERLVEPRSLVLGGDAWYLAGYCRLRGGERAFRLDRIEHLTVKAERFRPRALDPVPPPDTIDVQVRFSSGSMQWVRERQHWSFVREEQGSDHSVMIYAPRRLNEIAAWILGWGTEAEIIAPVELRVALRTEALRLAEMLT